MPDPVYLATCASCGGHPAATTYATEVPHPAPFHCPRCRPGLIPAEEHAQPETAVGLVDAAPEAVWVVLARDGDTVTIRPLGLPDFPSRDIPVGMIRPKFSYERLEEAKQNRHTADLRR